MHANELCQLPQKESVKTYFFIAYTDFGSIILRFWETNHLPLP